MLIRQPPSSLLSTSLAALRQRSFVHNAVLALVWLAFATSGLVFSEPCPTDVLALGLLILLPLVGMIRITPPLAFFLMAWAIVASCGLIAATFSQDTGKAVTHTLVSFFLAGYAFVLAGFIARDPLPALSLMFKGLTVASLCAALAGIAGYFGAFPGADIFTKFGRAAGTFKDPNVFGPFLVPSVLYAIQRALEKPIRRTLPSLALAGILALALFLSFSRGAWINLIVSLGLFLGLSFLTATSLARRQKIALLSIVGSALIGGVIAGALQNESVSALVSERASVTQSYDVGPEGRFGGQEKARALILDNPLGIGAAQFAPFYHHEEAHNVYLSMTLATGWAGSGIYLAMVLLTLALGLRQSFTITPWQPFLLIAVSTFAANAAEGFIIDSDHWRHFYILLAMVWGMVCAQPVPLLSSQPRAGGARQFANPRLMRSSAASRS